MTTPEESRGSSSDDELSDGQLNWLLDDPAGEDMLDQVLDEMYTE